MAVPQRYLMVWSGATFPYPCRLAAEAVLAAAPEAELEVHLLGEPPASEHFTGLFADRAGDGRLSLHHIDPDRLFTPALHRLFHRIPASALSAQSNLLRLALLHQRGGIYLDFDTLLLRPLHDLGQHAFVAREWVWRHDRTRVEHGFRPATLPGAAGWGVAWALKRADSAAFAGRLRLSRRLRRIDRRFHTLQANNAVIGASAGSEFTERLLSDSRWADPRVRYALGPALVEDTARAAPHTVTVVPADVLYAVPPGESYRFFDDRTLRLPAASRLVHYVSSNHRELISGIHPGDERFNRPGVFWQEAGRLDAQLRRGVSVPAGSAAT